LTLNFSCVDKKSSEKETQKPDLVETSETDTLKFTSGIRAIFQDSKGNYWFGSLQEGVAFCNGKSFKYFNSDDGLSDNQIHNIAFPPHKVLNHYDNLFAVTSISKGKKKMIWFGTYAGVFGYDGNGFKIINDEPLGLDRNIAPLHIRSIFEDSKGRLWIGNNGIGVLLKEGDTIINFSEKHNLIHPTSGKKGDKSMPGTLEHVFTIAEDEKGNIWFGDRDAGIWKYDGVKMTNYTKKDGLTNDNALSIFEDNKGELWFGMADGNIYKFNGKAFEKKF
jgi:ligand-binding sensor domain-containing protein